MATKALTLSIGGGSLRATWATLSTGDVGAVLGADGYNDKTVTIVGTATTFALQGSNDNSNWFTLHDIDMTTEITATGIYTIKENPVWIRPNLTTGSVDVVITCVG